MKNIPLPKALRKYRTEHNLTQAQLAEKLKVSQPSVNAWEAGKSTPSKKVHQEIVKLIQEGEEELVCPKEISVLTRLLEHFKPEEIPLLSRIIKKVSKRK